MPNKNPLPVYRAFLLCIAAGLLLSSASASDETAPETVYVRITRPAARVRSDLDPRSGMIGVAEKGQRYRMLNYTDDAFQIAYRGVEGWISRDKAEIARPASSSTLSVLLAKHGNTIIAVLLGAVVLAGLAVVGALLARNMAKRSAGRIASNKELVIVGTRPKEIRYSLSNSTSTIERCFSEIGFSVQRVPTLESFEQRVRHHVPDVVLVDWTFGPKVADEVEIVLAERPPTQAVPVIYFDVPNQEAAQRQSRLRHVYYLGTQFSDRDLFRTLQPHTIGGTQTAIIRKAADGSAIEGDLGDGGLSAVLQLVEIGHKTGCLLLRQEKPYGMIGFEGGNITYAATERNAGEKAVYELLGLTHGHFRFAAEQAPPGRNCGMSTMGVLMEWARLQDEASRD
jgi:hypothetical protein